MTAVFATFSALALTLGAAFFAALLALGLAVAVTCFAAEAAFLVFCFGLAAAFFAVVVAADFFFAGALDVDFLVMPAALVRGPGPLDVGFFLAGEGAAGLGAFSLACSCGWMGQLGWLIV